MFLSQSFEYCEMLQVLNAVAENETVYLSFWSNFSSYVVGEKLLSSGKAEV